MKNITVFAVGALLCLVVVSPFVGIQNGKLSIGLGYQGTKLHYAAADGDLKMVKELIASGVDVDVEDNAGGTPLIAAIESEQFQVADYLIEMGADIYHSSNSGSPFETYFRPASPKYGPNFRIVDYMLSKGYDPQRAGYDYPISEQEALRQE
jgi:hypothetical protein